MMAANEPVLAYVQFRETSSDLWLSASALRPQAYNGVMFAMMALSNISGK